MKMRFLDGNRSPNAQAGTGAHPGSPEGRHEEMQGLGERVRPTCRRPRVRKDSSGPAALEDTAGPSGPGVAPQAGTEVDQTAALREGQRHPESAVGDRDAQAIYEELYQM